MTCYSPMCRAERYGDTFINQKGGISYNYDFFTWEEYENGLRPDGRNHYDAKYRKIQMVPCGKCIGCRLDYSREWANRIMLETKGRDLNECWFITLTYNDENLPFRTVIDCNTGEEITGATLVKKDLSNFMKRLRRHWEHHYGIEGIKFYGCGEYGDTTHRPHYHIAIMGLPLDPLKLKKYKDTEAGRLWSWSEGEKIWGKGFCVIGRLTWDSAAYVARYVLKKQKGPEASNFYESKGIIPEFVNMSRRPGIGREYYEKNKEKIYEHDSLIIKSGNKIIEAKPPKYYDKLYDVENHEVLEKLKIERKRTAENVNRMKDLQTSKSRTARRETQKHIKEASTRILKRRNVE